MIKKDRFSYEFPLFLKKLMPAILILLLIYSCRHHRELSEDRFRVEHEDVRTTRATSPEHVVDLSYFNSVLGFEPSPDSDLLLLYEVAGWMGSPYRYGGKSKSGVDCSGLVLMVYRNVYDIELLRRSIDMAQNSRKIRDPQRLREGDLVFFRISGRNISHVGIYLGEGRFVHASKSRGVVINELSEPYYSERFAFGGRVLQ